MPFAVHHTAYEATAYLAAGLLHSDTYDCMQDLCQEVDGLLLLSIWPCLTLQRSHLQWNRTSITPAEFTILPGRSLSAAKSL